MRKTFFIIISLLTVTYRKLRNIKHHLSLYSIKYQCKSFGKNSQIGFPINISGLKYISVGDNFICNPRLRLDALEYIDKYPEVNIGDNVNINSDCHIGCVNKVSIGNNVLIASKVYISDHSHGDTELESLKISPRKRKIISKGPVEIKDNVWIGEGAVILPNVTIGENSIVGANAVVSKSVPPFSIVAGVPAKIIKTYSNNE